MTALPQDLPHFTNSAKKPDSPKTSTKTVLPTLRKRWDRPAPGPPKTEKMNLPADKRSSMPTMSNACKNKITPMQPKSSLNVSKLSSQNKLPDCPNKPSSKMKESQIELATLRKEVGTLKSENSILKARVRRVEEENTQKTRQMDKLQAELKVEIGNNKKNKENESVLLLRQKCLRLESALKEKDQTFKRFIAELTKSDELKEAVQKYCKEIHLPNGMGAEIFQNNSRTSVVNSRISVTSDSKSPKQSRININHQVSKSETEKLRAFIHKLEAQNKSLQTQVKEKDQEIRRLKLQMNTNSTGSSSRLHRKSSTPRSSSPVQNKSPNILSSQLTTRRPTKTSGTPMLNRTPQIRQAKTAVSPKRVISSSVRPATSPKNSTFIIKQNHSVPRQKPAFRKKPTLEEVEKAQLEQKVQNMRENAAARKIQKGWRNHKKMTSVDLSEEQEKALDVIVENLKAHELRKEKLIVCTEENSGLMKNLPENLLEDIMVQINAVYKTLYVTSDAS